MQKQNPKWKSWLITILGVMLALLIVGSSETFQNCLKESEAQIGQQDIEKGIAYFLGSFARYKTCGGHFLEMNGEGVIAAFTVILAISTILLWWSTRKLWDAGERQLELATKTAERELRAYIYVEGVEITPPDLAGPTEVRLTIKNNGQTPGYGVVHLGRMLVQDFPSLVPLPEVEETSPLSRNDLPPSGILTKTLKGGRALTPDERARIGNGTLALYVYGEIRYRDAFGRNRSTKYRMIRGGNVGVRATTMTTTEEGNESN